MNVEGLEELAKDCLEQADRVCRRVLDVSLDGLSAESAAMLKESQYQSKVSKENLAALIPVALERLRSLRGSLMLLPDEDSPYHAQAKEIFAELEQSLHTAQQDIVRNARAIDEVLKKLRRAGHPINTPEKDVINPVKAWWPRERKIAELVRLSGESEQIAKKFLFQIDRRYRTKSKPSLKEPSKILEKSQRPEILKRKPWFDTEHIRDSFRFKTVISDLSVLPDITRDLVKSGVTVVKCDIGKLLSPGMWGWRIVVFDLRMPNGQLAEYYLPVEELEEAKNSGNHEIFEKWRNRDLATLSDDEQLEFIKDQRLSDETYETAWQEYLKRTNQSEKGIGAILAKVRRVANAEENS